jgi:twinkle protein
VSKFIKHDTCPKCGREEKLAIYDDNENCMHVGCNYHKEYGSEAITTPTSKKSKDRPVTALLGGAGTAIKDRGLTSSTTTKYKVTVNTNPDSPVAHVYPYFNRSGSHAANKIRFTPEYALKKWLEKGKKEEDCDGKLFTSEGDFDDLLLFGMQEFQSGGKAITITEGELDALAAFELTGSRYPCVSVRGASSAKSDCAAVLDYLSTFEKVVICFDADEAGQKAALEVAQLFEPGKCHVMKMKGHKDASDYLKAGHAKQFIDEWYRAPAYTPDGLKIGKDMWDEIENHKDPKSVPYPFEGLNHHTYGIRQSELVIITAPTGIGKTSLLKKIEYSLLMNEELIEEKAGVGFLHFEEPNYDTVIGLMSIHAGKPYHLPDTARTTEELKEAYDAVVNNDRVVIWDHFGSNSIDAVLAKVRHMAALGCKYIVIDHLSIIVSDQSGDERKQLDEISTKLKTLCMEKDLAIIAVIHQNRAGEIRGTAGVEQLANIVMRLDRDMMDTNEWRRNITRISVAKNRFCGRSGPCCWVFYNDMTGQLEELTRDQITEYEAGGSGAGVEAPF